MNRSKIYHIKKLSLILFVLEVFIFSGCVSIHSSYYGSVFDSDGLPNQKYFVGGGLQINWIAPQNGTAYLIEETSGKIMITESLDSGDTFEFNPGSTEPEDTQRIFGAQMSELKFSLYFVPEWEQ